MIDQDTRTVFGYFILLLSVIAFGFAIGFAQYYLAALFVVGGLFLWLAYINVAGVALRGQLGSILILHGLLLAIPVFLLFAVEQDKWGGYHIKPDGATLTFVILFLTVAPGMIIRYNNKRSIPFPTSPTVPPKQPLTAPPTSDKPLPTGPPTASYPGWPGGTYGEDYEYYYDPEMMAAYYEDYEDEEDEEEEDEE